MRAEKADGSTGPWAVSLWVGGTCRWMETSRATTWRVKPKRPWPMHALSLATMSRAPSFRPDPTVAWHRPWRWSVAHETRIHREALPTGTEALEVIGVGGRAAEAVALEPRRHRGSGGEENDLEDTAEDMVDLVAGDTVEDTAEAMVGATGEAMEAIVEVEADPTSEWEVRCLGRARRWRRCQYCTLLLVPLSRYRVA